MPLGQVPGADGGAVGGQPNGDENCHERHESGLHEDEGIDKAAARETVEEE